MFYSSSRLQPTTDESRQSVQMSNHFTNRKSRTSVSIGAHRVLIASTAMLAFISFWRAAAVVLNDMGSSAFYAGAIAEHFVGKTAPWFVLAIMLLSYAVRSVYIESSSMFVRGGVYRVVKEAMGATLAKFSVSALMFDYILTGPISGVSAGLYLTGLLNELLHYAHAKLVLPSNGTAAVFAILVTIYFWWENIKGIPESSEKALRIMYVTTVMVVLMLAWCSYTLWVRGAHLPPWPRLSNLVYSSDALGWLRHTSLPYTVGLIGILIGLCYSVLAMRCEETMAQVYREIAPPKPRILNLVVGLQILTILLSRGNIFVLGEAYAFGVMWSFALKALAVLVLRYKEPGAREFRVPLNLRLGRIELPLGLGLITVILFALCLINLFTKQVATLSGVAFTIIFFAVFSVSERVTRSHATEHVALDQFNLEPGEDLTPEIVGVRPGNILVMVRNYNTLYNLNAVLDRVDTHAQDVVVLHLRFLTRAGSGEYELTPEQLFSLEEQALFTRSLAVAEKKGKTVHLAVAAATEKWDAILRAAQSLKSSTVVLGPSPNRPVTEEARIAGLAWERLPAPKPQLILQIYFPNGQEHVFYLGPHAPHLTPKEIDLLHRIWLQLSNEVAPEELHHHDVVHFALEELQQELSNSERAKVFARLRQHLEETQHGRAPHGGVSRDRNS